MRSPHDVAGNLRDESTSFLTSLIGQGVGTANWDLVYEVTAGNVLQLRELLVCNNTGAAQDIALMVAPSSYVPIAGFAQPYVVLTKSVPDVDHYRADLVTAVPSSFKIWFNGAVDVNYHISGIPVQR